MGDQEQPWEVSNGLRTMGGTVISAGEAGQLWEFNGQQIGVPWCLKRARQSWVDANLSMVKRISEAHELQAWRVYTILSGQEPKPKVMAQFVPGEVLAAAFASVQGAVLDLRHTAWQKEREGAVAPDWSEVAQMLTGALLHDFSSLPDLGQEGN